MQLIGLSGKKRTGKDTIAKIIESYIKSKNPKAEVIKLAFATEVKKEVAKACGVTVEFMEEHKEIFRPIYQWWGTDFRRNPVIKGKDDYWISKVMMELYKLPNHVTVIITDVRFPNEANMIKQVNGNLWRVVRFHKDFSELDGHHSEIALDDYQHFDEVITNNATTVEELKSKIINLYNKYYGKATV